MQKITKNLCNIIQQAAKITTRPFEIYDKDDFGDIVTDIDKEVETFITNKLNQKYPDFEVISEEFNPNKGLTENCFIIDPIDGTKNFAAGLPLWGMQVAAMQDGEVVSSVIYIPRLNELYYADCDGTFLNDKRLEIKPTSKHPIYGIEGGDKLPAAIELEKELGNGYRRLSSSSVAYAWVAAGRMNAFNLRKDTKWDYIPGMYLVKMAGGFIKDMSGAHVAASDEKLLKTLSKYTATKK